MKMQSNRASIFPMEASTLAGWTQFAEMGGLGSAVSIRDCLADEPGQLMFLAGDRIVILARLLESETSSLGSSNGGEFLGQCEGVLGVCRGEDLEFENGAPPIPRSNSARTRAEIVANVQSVFSLKAELGGSSTPSPISASFKGISEDGGSPRQGWRSPSPLSNPDPFITTKPRSFEATRASPSPRHTPRPFDTSISSSSLSSASSSALNSPRLYPGTGLSSSPAAASSAAIQPSPDRETFEEVESLQEEEEEGREDVQSSPTATASWHMHTQSPTKSSLRSTQSSTEPEWSGIGWMMGGNQQDEDEEDDEGTVETIGGDVSGSTSQDTMEREGEEEDERTPASSSAGHSKSGTPSFATPSSKYGRYASSSSDHSNFPTTPGMSPPGPGSAGWQRPRALEQELSPSGYLAPGSQQPRSQMSSVSYLATSLRKQLELTDERGQVEDLLGRSPAMQDSPAPAQISGTPALMMPFNPAARTRGPANSVPSPAVRTLAQEESPLVPTAASTPSAEATPVWSESVVTPAIRTESPTQSTHPQEEEPPAGPKWTEELCESPPRVNERSGSFGDESSSDSYSPSAAPPRPAARSKHHLMTPPNKPPNWRSYSASPEGSSVSATANLATPGVDRTPRTLLGSKVDLTSAKNPVPISFAINGGAAFTFPSTVPRQMDINQHAPARDFPRPWQPVPNLQERRRSISLSGDPRKTGQTASARLPTPLSVATSSPQGGEGRENDPAGPASAPARSRAKSFGKTKASPSASSLQKKASLPQLRVDTGLTPPSLPAVPAVSPLFGKTSNSSTPTHPVTPISPAPSSLGSGRPRILKKNSTASSNTTPSTLQPASPAPLTAVSSHNPADLTHDGAEFSFTVESADEEPHHRAGVDATYDEWGFLEPSPVPPVFSMTSKQISHTPKVEMSLLAFVGKPYNIAAAKAAKKIILKDFLPPSLRPKCYDWLLTSERAQMPLRTPFDLLAAQVSTLRAPATTGIDRTAHLQSPFGNHRAFKDGFSAVNALQDVYTYRHPKAPRDVDLSWIAATFAMVGFDAESSFKMFEAWVDRFGFNHASLALDSAVFEKVLSEHAPKLAKHLVERRVHASMFLPEWIASGFLSSMPYPTAQRCFDLLVCDVDRVAIAVGIATLMEKGLLGMRERAEIVARLQHPPADAMLGAESVTKAALKVVDVQRVRSKMMAGMKRPRA